MIRCYPLDTALPLDDFEQQHRQNTAILMYCFEQRTMLAAQREALTRHRFADPLQSPASDLAAPKITFDIRTLVEQA